MNHKFAQARHVYLFFLHFALVVIFLIAADEIVETAKAKKASMVSLPRFDELISVEGSVRSFRVMHGGKYENDTAVIRLESGGEFWMSAAVWELLEDSGFDENIAKGDLITLWVTNKKEATLDEKVPAIYQIKEGNGIYLRYEEVRELTEMLRNSKVETGNIFAVVFACIGVVTYAVYMVLYVNKMYIPRKTLKKMGFKKEDFDAWDRYRSDYIEKRKKRNKQ